MKKIFLLICILSISIISYAQKNELKAASKALKSNQFDKVVSILNPLKSSINNAKTKYQSEYHLLLGKALYANGTKPNQIIDAAKELGKSLEVQSNGTTANEAEELRNKIVKTLAAQGSENYSEGNQYSTAGDQENAKKYFSKSAKAFENVYFASSVDTAFYQNAGYVYHLAGDYQKSIDIYNKLLDLNYTGAGTTYAATNSTSGQTVYFNTKKEMDNQVKLGLCSNPKVEKKEPQTAEMKRMISKNYTALGDNDKALSIIQDARKDNPKDFSLLVDEAYANYNAGNKEKFKSLLEEAISINPNDHILHYNIGVMKSEMGDTDGAISSYKKAINIKSDYVDAYRNLGAAVLDKAKPIVEEMNKNLDNFDKYDKLQAKQLEVYKEALPYFEKAHELEPRDTDNIQVLVGIYEQLEMYDKSKAMKTKLESLK